jgi:putative copper export protein
MRVLSARWLRVTIDVLHDLAAGTWPGAVVAFWLARNRAAALDPEALDLTVSTWSSVFWVMVVALALLVGTGLVRSVYRGIGIPPELLEARTKVALIKHLVFVSVFIYATVVAIRLLQR